MVTVFVHVVDDLNRFYAELPPDIETISEPYTTESGTRILFLRSQRITSSNLLRRKQNDIRDVDRR